MRGGSSDPDALDVQIRAIHLTTNSDRERWRAAAVIAERHGPTEATLTLLHALDLTEVTRCAPDAA